LEWETELTEIEMQPLEQTSTDGQLFREIRKRCEEKRAWPKRLASIFKPVEVHFVKWGPSHVAGSPKAKSKQFILEDTSIMKMDRPHAIPGRGDIEAKRWVFFGCSCPGEYGNLPPISNDAFFHLSYSEKLHNGNYWLN
jgi:hypothetical protein